MINLEKINERKEVIAKDIESVRTRLNEYDKAKEKDTALLNALLGAFQQCDAFLKELDDDNPEGGSDVENNLTEDEQKIGGTD
tara:strand:+ start:291 stop:539 length:249 start_codon:yes stop_codon:yes gene_type:complete